MSSKRHNKKLFLEELRLEQMNDDALRWVKGGMYQDATAEEEGEFDEEEEGGEA